MRLILLLSPLYRRKKLGRRTDKLLNNYIAVMFVMIGTQIYLNPDPIFLTTILSCFTEYLPTGKNFRLAHPYPTHKN